MKLSIFLILFLSFSVRSGFASPVSGWFQPREGVTLFENADPSKSLAALKMSQDPLRGIFIYTISLRRPGHAGFLRSFLGQLGLRASVATSSIEENVEVIFSADQTSIFQRTRFIDQLSGFEVIEPAEIVTQMEDQVVLAATHYQEFQRTRQNQALFLSGAVSMDEFSEILEQSVAPDEQR